LDFSILIFSVYISLVALIFFQYRSNRLNVSLILIVIFSFICRLFNVPLLYLHTWDERFHALVAKNLIENPFKPSLISENLLALESTDWSCNYIWLSKPPLALWNIALSLNIFGLNELGVRLPSLIFGTASVLLTYKICLLLYNKKLAIFAAFFHGVNGLILDVSGGKISSDHVDTLFLFLSQISFFFLIKFIYEKSTQNLLFSGMLAGFCFLTKWSLAFFIPIVLIVFFILFKYTFLQKVKYSLYFFAAFFTIVFPWIFYALLNFPEEMKFMLGQIFMPVSNVIQNHSGPFYYYLNSIRINFHEL
jgi:4-amino-4-deoxy-L-arabinose transferase-like glycosyltransferase